MNLTNFVFSVALIAVLSATTAVAQNDNAETKPADAKLADSKAPHPAPVDPNRGPEIYQTFYLKNAGTQNDLNDIQTAIRNLLGRARLFAVPSQNAITMRATADDLATTQKLITELDLPKKAYRLTYTIAESENGKRIGIQHFAIVVVPGEKTDLKQGSKIPIMVGSGTGGSDHTNQVEYEDVGLEIWAQLVGYADGLRLSSKVTQSSLMDEKSGVGAQDPVIRDTTLEGTSTLAIGKPLALGSLDIPGSTRHQDIEVVAELIR